MRNDVRKSAGAVLNDVVVTALLELSRLQQLQNVYGPKNKTLTVMINNSSVRRVTSRGTVLLSGLT